jgi:methionyl-tRNA formyltransferase
MDFIAIGRSWILVNSIELLLAQGHDLRGIVTAKPAPEYQDSLSKLEQIAGERSIPFLNSSNLKLLAKFVDDLECGLDFAISANYTAILDLDIISRFRLGILNAHGGDLPRYRGNACQAWAIINGETRIALCIHKMEPEILDAGPIIERAYLDIDEETYVSDCMDWIVEQSPKLFSSAVSKLEIDPEFVLELQSNDPSESLRCFPRRPEDGKIYWNTEAKNIHRLIRASSRPFSGAFSFIDQKEIRVFQSELVKVNPYLAQPGQILHIGIDYLIVAAVDGPVKLMQFELEGKSVQVDEFAWSIRQRFSS